MEPKGDSMLALIDPMLLSDSDGEEEEDWEATWAEIESGNNGTEESHLAISTQAAIKQFGGWWSRFNKDVLCKRVLRNADDALACATSVEIKLFLAYRIQKAPFTLDGKAIRRSTVELFYKMLQLMYRIKTKNSLLRSTNDDIHRYIKNDLTKKYGLDLNSKDKATCSVTDLFNLLNYHWCQDSDSECHGRYAIQVALLMQLIAYTSTRPGSIIESNCYRGLGQVLKYKDMNLCLIRNLNGGEATLVLEVTTTYLKGKRNTREPVTFLLYQRPDNPIFCPIMNFLALAFADNAFREDLIQKPEDLYSLRIPHFKETMSIPWKPCMMETPVFRRQKGDEICATTPLAYTDLSYCLRRLGKLAGFPQDVTTYAFRRGAAKVIDCPEVTDVQRNKIMGHKNAEVFRRHYTHRTIQVDTMSLYLETIDRSDLIKMAGLMSAKRDPRAPIGVKHGDIDFKNHPQLVSSQQKSEKMLKDLRLKFGSAAAAKRLSPELYSQYQRQRNKVYSRKRHLVRTEGAKLRKQWFELVDHKEIKSQLGGGLPSEFTYPVRKFDCPLRAKIADYHNNVGDMEWVDAVRALAALCLQKPPIHTKESKGSSYCPFCLRDDKLRPSDKYHSFHSPATLRTHIHRKHKAVTTSTDPVNCPFSQCETMLDDGEHMKCHLALDHDLRLCK